ncbi:MAG: threonine--tRNA ligase [Candidatus Undinarchaeales archaeon]
MKLLLQHVDYVNFKVTKKTKLAQELSEKEKKGEMKDCLFVRFAAEKDDEVDEKKVAEKSVKNILDVASEVKVKKVVLYPYVHLLSGSKPSGVSTAIHIHEKMKKLLEKEGFEVLNAPFGWYKQFEMKCKGHPMSELSRVVRLEESKKKKEEKKAPEKPEDEEEEEEVKLGKQTVHLDREKLSENDHRIIGQDMDLYSFQKVGPGMVFFHSKGWAVRNKMIQFMREKLDEAGYEEINTPIILDKKLWKVSGHWDHYKDHMFFTKVDDRDFAVKPMNCPGGILVYKNESRSYNDLPLRMSEFGLVSRDELSGVLSGLFRLRTFTQDDAHIYCTEEQMESELEDLIKLIDIIYKTFGFKYKVELSTRPENAMGDKRLWDKAEKTLKKALDKKKIKYKINEGDGAFYGSKIDYHVTDSLGRDWQCGTVQLDFLMPERFELTYIDSNGEEKRPVMIHRAIYGSLERFLGVLVEHYKGKFPLWLSPEQVTVLTMNEDSIDYAKKVVERLEKEGFKVSHNYDAETIESKIRDAQLQHVNYTIVVGEKEIESETIAVRNRKGKVKYKVKLDDFVDKLKKEIKERKWQK